MPAKVTTIDQDLAALKGGQRAALEKLRKTIQAAAPRAEETISYQLPAFRLDGMPSSFVLDRRGRIRFTHVGYDASVRAAHAREIDELLAEEDPRVQK